jgi:surface polysaccharide O-acyltransferase-like enzyme
MNKVIFVINLSICGLFNHLKPSGKHMSHLLLTISNSVFCIYVFHMTVSVNTDYFLKRH